MKKKLWLCILRKSPIKSGLFILYFLVCSHLVFPQQIEWISQIDYSFNNSHADASPILKIETDSVGNVYAAGTYSVPYINGYAADHHRGFFLEKRDRNGNIIWKDTIASTGGVGKINLSLKIGR